MKEEVIRGQDLDVDEAVEDLIADFERIGRPLEMERVERLAASRKLRFAQVEQILDALASAGVPILVGTLDDSESDDMGEADQKEVRLGSARHWQAILDHPLLDAKTEVELGRMISAGVAAQREIEEGSNTERAREAVRRGKAARDRLASSNFRLVWTSAVKYAGMTGLDPTDLFQDGIIGLLRAIDKYDPEAGFRFSTYAVWWIRQSVQRAVADKGKTVRVPMYVHEELIRLARATRLLWMENGSRPSLAKLAEELACDREHIAFLQGLSSLVPVSLNEPTLDGEGEALVETLAADSPTPESLVELNEESRIVREAVHSLPHRVKMIVARRYGIETGKEETLESIGSSIGLTRERVRQIEQKGMQSLKKTLPLALGLPPIGGRPPVDSPKLESSDPDKAANQGNRGNKNE